MADKEFKTLDIFDDDENQENNTTTANDSPVSGEDSNKNSEENADRATSKKVGSNSEDSSDKASDEELDEALNDEDNLLVFSTFKKHEDQAVEILSADDINAASAAKAEMPEQKKAEEAKQKAVAKDTAPRKRLSAEERMLRAETLREQRMAEPIVKRTLRFIGNFILVCGCLAVIVGSLVAALLSIYIVNVTEDDGDLLKNYSLSYTTILYARDSDTNEYTETQRLYGNENRIWVSYGSMPKHLINAAIAVEDRGFMEHDGIDWKRTAAAAINTLSGGRLLPTTQGGSTITQQLVKNITGDNAVDSVSGILRKMREIYRSLMLENTHSKTEIIEAYLNTIRLSGQYAGVEAGANAYFNCHTEDLTIAQSAALVAVTNNPSIYSPLSNPERNKTRREWIIGLMLEQELITQEEYDAAMEESANLITVNSVDENGNYVIPRDQLISSSPNDVFDWFTDMVIVDVLEDLVNIGGYTSAEANNLLYNGGLRVFTTMDPDVQAVYNQLGVQSFWPTNTDSEGRRQEGAVISIDASNGAIVGVMGKIGEKTQSRVYNIATDGVRQVGSSMKPLGVYGPAVEMNAIHFSSLFEDQPIAIMLNGRLQNYPVNYWRTYGDPITISYAVEQSYNTVAVRVLRMISFEYSYAYVTNLLGITTMDPVYDKTYSSLALGGSRTGISLEELTAAYVPFANGGMYYEPHSYTRITTADGRVILDKEANLTSIRAFTPETAMIMNRLLQRVVSHGSGNAARYGSMPLGGKTGTTTDEADYLFVGFNPYYVTGAWAGFEYNTGTRSRYPVTTRTAFKYVMSRMSEGLPYKDFPSASGVVSAQFCTVSGGLATGSCPTTQMGYYKSSFMPSTCQHGYYAPDEESTE